MKVLGIETSCDETAASVVLRDAQGRGEILSSIVLSQTREHESFGGVVPEIAARAHVEALDDVVAAALREAGASLRGLDGVAATAGPGLVGGLLVGLMTAKALSAVSSLPLLPVNHLEGHALTARLTDGIGYPFLLLLVSGGHTQVLAVHGLGRYERYASTIDDALGEAFDKAAKLLGLPFPGGPAVEKAAKRGDPRRWAFPRPMKGDRRPDFSFSGLKTALRQAAEAVAPLSEGDVADLCASFQAAVTDALRDRVSRALEKFRAAYPALQEPVLVAAGGVAANAAIRESLADLCARKGLRFVAPPLQLCGDNAAMIAWAGAERLAAGLAPKGAMALAPRSRWPLDEAAVPLVGAGRRGAKA
ncbi:MAG TPA: tRNA (adenosine(37)-N6)-threonylcarbamoyltransferase complex transferase subunit TsaD [Mesorhizobium sp.]|nr:tRNA (adenosine(37)-N6)-threonylcarbamoyltransferase complex transferase subunit TsaD [Mesorhizobium sp.]